MHSLPSNVIQWDYFYKGTKYLYGAAKSSIKVDDDGNYILKTKKDVEEELKNGETTHYMEESSAMSCACLIVVNDLRMIYMMGLTPGVFYACSQ